MSELESASEAGNSHDYSYVVDSNFESANAAYFVRNLNLDPHGGVVPIKCKFTMSLIIISFSMFFVLC